jgi:uncharacterized protein with HEPN domain
MKLEVKKLLYDIQTSIDSIHEYLGEKRDFFDYKQNKLVRRAVEREIEIIGEAVSRLLKSHPEIILENGRQIVNTRNWVIHGYDKVDDVIIWSIITNHLPKLKSEVSELLLARD